MNGLHVFFAGLVLVVLCATVTSPALAGTPADAIVKLRLSVDELAGTWQAEAFVTDLSGVALLQSNSITLGLHGMSFDVVGSGSLNVSQSYVDLPEFTETDGVDSFDKGFCVDELRLDYIGSPGLSITATHELYNISSSVSGSSSNNILEGVGLAGLAEDNINNPLGLVANPVVIAHGSFTGTDGMLLLKSSIDSILLLPDSESLPAPGPEGTAPFFNPLSPTEVESHAVYIGSSDLGAGGLSFGSLQAVRVEILTDSAVTTDWADLSGELIIDGSLEINVGSQTASSLGSVLIGDEGFLGFVNNPPAANELIQGAVAEYDSMATVPEPVTLALLTFGACCLVRRRRQR